MGRYSRLPIGGGVTISGGGSGVGGAANLANAGRIVKVSASGVVTQSAGWTDSSGHLLAVTDNTYDIGASGATRPRNLYVAGAATVGGDLTVTGTITGTISQTLVMRETQTAAASATLDFTTWYNASYDVYLIELINIIPATNDTTVLMRMSTDGGSSYDSGANYSWDGFLFRAGGTALFGGAAQTSIALSGGGNQVNTSTEGMCGIYYLFNPGSTAVYKRVRGSACGRDSGFRHAKEMSGAYESATAVNAFRIFAGVGNLTSGIVRVYGIRTT